VTTARRVAAVERALQPEEVVLRVIAEAQEHASLDAYARAVADVPVEAAPLSRILAESGAKARATARGQPRENMDKAVRRAVGDSMFRYILFLRLNTEALEIADHEGLRASAASFWMGSLLGGPREDDLEPAEWAEHQEDLRRCWKQWRSLVASLLVSVLVEEEAREALQSRYLGGRSALFADTATVWDRFADLVDRLWSIAETRRTDEDQAASERAEAEGDPLANRVADRAERIADDARVSTFERLGDMPRAVAIMERRLRAS
jgi:hypothetical protein